MQIASKVPTPQHALPELAYSMDALGPFMSGETLEYHYGKHHWGYVNKLNSLVAAGAATHIGFCATGAISLSHDSV